MTITKHSKERMVERMDEVINFTDAKKMAKIARVSGKTINQFQKYPQFYSYLQNKKSTNTCSIRVYRNKIFIWKGKKALITVYGIPEMYIKEMEEN